MVICFTLDEHVDNLVETVEYAKLLGVTLPNDLTWSRHVECIVNNAAKRVYTFFIMLHQL